MTVTITRYVSATSSPSIAFAQAGDANAAGKLALNGPIRYEINRKVPNVRIVGGEVVRSPDTGMEGSSILVRFKATTPAAADLATLRDWASERGAVRGRLHGRFGYANTVNPAFDLVPTSEVGLKIGHLHVEEDPNGAVTGTLRLVLDGPPGAFG